MQELGFKFGERYVQEKYFDPSKKNAACGIRFPGTRYKSLIFTAQFFEHKMKYTTDNLEIWKLGIRFENNFIYFKLFYDELIKIFESGIPNLNRQYGYNNMEKEAVFKIADTKLNNRILSLEDLESGFFIWLVTLLIAIVVFIFEKIIFKIMKKDDASFFEEENLKIVKIKIKKRRPKKVKFIRVKKFKI